ncbi:hypothetical protein [Streptomyces fuscichromogenes]|uniref:Uncharacterized protein n=1 Tax=Streptomyces fuscichromogenes TaxID=1324013 RepID=A0A917XQ71_9ACTN|nr:hypothetical protein [Streptomyces fuscichromogenes]GGN47518.1 hypothetical protein GCM10011578_101110 [Streptomyces fuscichromogenes]
MNHHHDEVHYGITGSRVGFTIARCGHGDEGIAIELHGIPCEPGALPPLIDTSMPRCAFAEIVGAVLDGIRRREGDHAVRRFRDQIDAAQKASAAQPWTS